MQPAEWWSTFPRRGWRDDARCRDVDPDRFYGRDTRRMKRFCLSCPVIEDCLAFAMKNEFDTIGGRFGLYGGMLPHERESFGRALETAGLRAKKMPNRHRGKIR